EAEEECCDGRVVAVLSDAAPAYASALVETVTFLAQTRAAAQIGASGAGQVPLLKRRLTMILTATPSNRPSRIGFWAMLGLGTLLLPLAPGMAQTERSDRPIPPTGANSPEHTTAIHPEVEQRLNEMSFEKPLRRWLATESCRTCHETIPSWEHGYAGDKSET